MLTRNTDLDRNYLVDYFKIKKKNSLLHHRKQKLPSNETKWQQY